VSLWVLRGLREGVVTTRWPVRPDPYAETWCGPAIVTRDHRPGSGAELARLCPTGAISSGPGQAVTIDQGRCILCGRCVAGRPDLFSWSAGPASAALTRSQLIVPETTETMRGLAEVRSALVARTAALRRSVHVRHVDAGSDGAEEQEIAALLNPVYDIHRLGIFFTASPRHADVLLVTGAGAAGMTEPLRETYAGMPDPKVVIAVGTDAVSGGLLTGSPRTSGGVGGIVPVDIWLPGSPPSPFSILHALLAATGQLTRELIR
jgi:Ni,Fe-hydrogenase III small subunit/ferredoxin